MTQTLLPGNRQAPTTIMIIEDNPITRKMLRVALESAGYTALEVADGESAVALLRDCRPSLIIQDMLLPGIDGVELIKRLRALPNGADLPILALSGFLSHVDETDVASAGFSGFLLKPIEPSRLVQAIQTHLPPPSPPPEQIGRGRRILIADDDSIQRKLLGHRLSQLGFQVTSAANGASALDEAQRNPPDAIMSDILMPQLDGFDLCLSIRRHPRLATIPVVLITSSSMEEADRRLAENAGTNAYVVRTPDFQEAIDALLHSLRVKEAPRPAAPQAMLTEEHAHRVIRQLERQASMNAALAQGSALQAAQLSVLAGVSEVLMHTVDIEQILGEILARCLDAAGTSQGAVYLVEPDGRLALLAQLGYPESIGAALETFFGQADLLHQVLASGEALGLPAPAPALGPARDLLKRAGARSMLITPLISGKQRLGLVMMASANRDLGEDWITFAKAVGYQISQAIALGRTVTRLAESEQRYRDLVEDLDAIVWEAEGMRRQFSYVSRRAEEILGYPAEDWLAKPGFWADRIHPEDRQHVLDTCGAAVVNGKDHEIEYRALAANGRTVWLHDIVRVLGGDHGQARRLRGLMVDITQHKRLEEQFRQAQKMEAIGRLAGGIAHDFNNLITAITGYCDLLLSDFEEHDTRRDDVAEIRKASDRAAGLTRQLLAFSRKQLLAPQVLDVNTVVANMDRLLRRMIGEDIDLVTVLDPQIGRIKADPGQIEQVIMNLAVNARDAMPIGGKLTIETANVDLEAAAAGRYLTVRSGPYVQLAVSDTGEGMDGETLSHLFEPFFTTKEQGKGTGLGLSTVYGIVKQSGGDIWPYSELRGGTTFKIYLPRVDEPLEPAAPYRRLGLPTSGSETILLVEDEPTVQALVCNILERQGYTVLQARHGVEAIRIAGEHQGSIALLLTDVVMPEMSGRELAERMVTLRPEIRVLYISGYADTAIVHHGVLHADAFFLQKPFSPDELTRRVRLILDGGSRTDH